MPGLTQLRQQAVLLSDDSIGVSTESNPRKIQENYRQNGFYCSIDPDWLSDLNLAAQGEATVHSKSMGIKPVIVQHPAIIIQPASVLEQANNGGSNGNSNGGGFQW